jgi:nucleotidyltransferase/DNA polymerase involved in DNA repair
MPRFVCVFWPDFAAWAARRTDPALAGKVILIHQRGYIVAASPAAYDNGAQHGWTLHRAQAQLQPRVPDVVFLPFHGPTVNSAWSDVLDALLDITPCIESPTPGFLLADIRPPQAIKPLLRIWANEEAPVRAGVADDRAAAELAALTARPGTMRKVPPGQSVAFLQCVPMSSLTALTQVFPRTGIKDETVARLHLFGWHSVGDLAPISKRQLVSQFDQGELLFRYAQSSDFRTVPFYRQPPTASATFIFEQAIREPWEWEGVLTLLVSECLAALKGQAAQCLSMALDTGDAIQRASHLLHAATTVPRTFLETAHRLMIGRFRGVAFYGVTLQLRDLQSVAPVQGSLFDDGRQARDKAQKAIRAMQRRFPGALQRVVMLDKKAYLPERAFRLEPITEEHTASTSTKPAPRKARR